MAKNKLLSIKKNAQKVVSDVENQLAQLKAEGNEHLKDAGVKKSSKMRGKKGK